jgi:formate-dependent nitrite reductase membrane component NrfD
VPAYFWTKAISAGALALPALARAVEGLTIGTRLEVVLGLIGLVFMAVTGALLVSDLSRPERFLAVLAHPQARSWVSRGAFLIALYSALSACFTLSAWTGAGGLASALLWPTATAGLLAAVYTAFLFGQCKGRDLWQSPLLSVHLVAQWVLASGAVLVLLPRWCGVTPRLHHAAIVGLAVSLLVHGLVMLAELAMPHPTDAAHQAAGIITRGTLKQLFWAGAVGVGLVLPAVMLGVCSASRLAVGVAGVGALTGLLAFEWCFVMAGQAVANS